VHLVDLIIRIYHDARSPERQKQTHHWLCKARKNKLREKINNEKWLEINNNNNKKKKKKKKKKKRKEE